VRGGDEGQPQVIDQMRDAVDQFFHEAGIIESLQAKGLEIHTPEKSNKRSSFRRSTSGMSDLVGSNNGNRRGGFVLVIDGTALGHVSLYAVPPDDCAN
jgi:phospholipid-translocating ATPase